MPRYTYIAKSQPNKTIQADIEADSEQDAINKLAKIGYFPVLIEPQNLSLKKGILHFRKISNKDVLMFTRQLSSLTESGVNIITSLDIISKQTSNKYLKLVLGDIISKIKDGKSLSDSLSMHPYAFKSLYTSIVHSGEAGGNVEQSLLRLADFMEKDEEFKNSLLSSLIYPFFIFGISVLTVIVLLGFVIPKLVTMFEDMGQILPLPTKILIASSSALRNYWWFALAIIIIFIFLFRRLSARPQTRIFLDRLKLKAGIFGDIVLKTQISRLMRTLSLLLSSGMPVVQSLDISTSGLENEVLRLELEEFQKQIAGGSSFSKCLQGSKLFPAFVVNVIAVGEETGNLERSLLRIADDYENELERSLKNLTRLIEPVIILVMGLVVGFIVLSMLLPIFQINLIVK